MKFIGISPTMFLFTLYKNVSKQNLSIEFQDIAISSNDDNRRKNWEETKCEKWHSFKLWWCRFLKHEPQWQLTPI